MSQQTTPAPSTIIEPSNVHFFKDLMKRSFDLVLSSLGLLILSPFFLLIAYRIKRDSPGPVFYRGERLGKGGKPLKIIKFRTMYERPESYRGLPVTAESDPRITSYGRYLRQSKINELPQLWNVLKGKMSLVGPRPEDPQVVAEWSQQVREEILSVRPGITSPSSVRYRREEQMLDREQVMDSYMDDILPNKLRMDQLYVRQRSFWGDLDILFWTSLALAPRMESFEPSDKRLYVGPVSQLMRQYINWFFIDLIIALIAIGITGMLWRSFGPLDIGWKTALIFAIGFALLCSLMGWLLGVQRISWSKSSGTDAIDLVPPVFFATLIALFLNQFILMKDPENSYAILVSWSSTPLLPIPMILLASTLAFLGFVVVRYRSRLVTGTAKRWLLWRGSTGAPQERVLIIGSGETGQFASWMLSEGKYGSSFRVIGFVDDDLRVQGRRIRGLNVLGGRKDIPIIVGKYDVGIILYAIHNISAHDRADLLNICSQTQARVVVFPDILAAMNLASRNGNGRKSALKVSPATSPLPCHLCLTKLSPMKVDAWLAQLDDLIQSGDFESAQVQIKEIRAQVRGDATSQLAMSMEIKDED